MHWNVATDALPGCLYMFWTACVTTDNCQNNVQVAIASIFVQLDDITALTTRF